jgi:hypothetical protein
MNNNDETDRAKGEKKIILPANVEGGQIRNHAMKYRFWGQNNHTGDNNKLKHKINVMKETAESALKGKKTIAIANLKSCASFSKNLKRNYSSADLFPHNIRHIPLPMSHSNKPGLIFLYRCLPKE